MAKGKSTDVAELRRTAIHEAGHAVLQTALGIGCEGISIVPDHVRLTAGSSAHGGQYGHQGSGLGEPDDDVSTLRVYAGDAFLLRHAISDYAGAEAVRRAHPRRKDWKAGADDDYRQAAYRINDITSDQESIDLLFAYAKRRCAVLVEHYWPEIQALAGALLKARKIPGARVRKIIRTSLDKRRAARLAW